MGYEYENKDNTGVGPAEEIAPAVLDVKNLVVHYETTDGVVEAINNVSFSVGKGEAFGLVGETGAGKTSIALSIMGLLPFPPSHIYGGSIKLDGEELISKTNKIMRTYRGRRLSMIFQDPMTALNPVQTVGVQLIEILKIHTMLSKHEARKKAIGMLETVGIRPERFDDYPHQLSGGMKQRVVIAMSLLLDPELIIADEPTTALDVTIQAQVLDLIKKLQREHNTSLLLITHDFGVVAEICTKCAVIYAGEIVEMGTVEHIFDDPLHPYTVGLFASLPSIEGDDDQEFLKPIKGRVADPMDLPGYCTFADRCECCMEKCKESDSILIEVGEGHFVKCLKYLEGGARS